MVGPGLEAALVRCSTFPEPLFLPLLWPQDKDQAVRGQPALWAWAYSPGSTVTIHCCLSEKNVPVFSPACAGSLPGSISNPALPWAFSALVRSLLKA